VKLSLGSAHSHQRFMMKIAKPTLIILFVLVAGLLCSAQQPVNTINTIAGGGATPTNPLSLDMPGPTSVLEDGSGNLYFTAPASAYVWEMLTSGNIQNYSGLGWGYFAGDGGPVGSANVGQVTDIVMDSKGNIYMADIGASRIRMVNTSGIINTVAGSGTKCDDETGSQACGDGASATAATAELNIPTSITVDSAGNIYITDTVDNRIRVVNPSASAVTIAGTSVCAGCIATIVGDGNACSTTTNPTCGDGGPASAAEVNDPKGIFITSTGDLYIADTGDQEIRVIKAANAGGTTITSYAGQVHAACPQSTSGCNDGSQATSGLLRLPQGIMLDSNGNGYIADTGDHKLRYVNASTGVINTMAGTGVQGFAGDGGLAQQAELDAPNGLFVDSSLHIWVADTGNQRIREFLLAGNISTIAGGSLGDGPALSAQFAEPYFVAEDASGNIYFTDQANNRVRKLTPGGGTYTVSTVAGTGSAGFSGDGGLATAATLSAPTGLALDNLGNLYVNDTNNLVIRQINLSSGIIKTVAGTPGVGCPPPTGCGDGAAATSASFTNPLGITTDSHGNLIIADYLGYRVRAVNMGSSTTTISNISIGSKDIATIAGIGTQGDCSFGHTCNGTAIKLGINHPGGVAVDGSGNVYFSDQWNNQVRIITTAGILNNYALNGKPGPMGDGNAAATGAMWNPLLVTLDPLGNLYISGGNDNLVQRVDVSTTGPGGPHEIGTVVGQPSNPTIGGFGGDTNLATANNVRIANLGSSVDAAGNLYIADGGNNRIRYVPMGPSATSSVTSMNLGSSPIGTKSSGKTMTLTSAGGVELVVSSIGLTGTNANQFAQTNTCGTTPVNMGEDAHCTVTVTMTPSQYGAISATLSVTDNAPNSPQTVSLTGSGPDYTISASPSALKIAQGAQGTSTVTLTPVAQFNQLVGLTCTGVPTGTTCSLNPTSVQMNGSTTSTSTLTINVGSTTPTGAYTLVVGSTFQNLTHNVNVHLTVIK